MRKFIIVFLLLLSTLVFAKSVIAADSSGGGGGGGGGGFDGSWYVLPAEEWSQKVSQPPPEDVFQERYFLKIVSDMMNSVGAAVGGPTMVTQGPNGPVYTQEGGAIDVIANLTGTLYTVQPASSVEYLAYVGQNLGLVKPAYAQGLGFSAFSPVLGLWKIFRDIAYLGFVVIFVIVGFMIMFRRKIDPRTVVTIQEALPRIVVALILVTFSYAIAGLVIDTGELTTRLVGNTLAEKGLIAQVGGKKDETVLKRLLQSNTFDLTNQLRIPSHFASRITSQLFASGEGAQKIPEPFKALASVTIWFILTIAGIFVMFKIFFALLGPYVSIVLYVIFAPFMLMLSAIPGTQFSLAEWLKTLISKVAVFPVTFSLLAIAAILKGTNEASLFGGVDWHVQEKTYGMLWSPATIGSFGDVAGMLVAFGILFAIPKVAEGVQEALKVKPSPLTQAGEAGLRGLPIIGRFSKS